MSRLGCNTPQTSKRMLQVWLQDPQLWGTILQEGTQEAKLRSSLVDSPFERARQASQSIRVISRLFPLTVLVHLQKEFVRKHKASKMFPRDL